MHFLGNEMTLDVYVENPNREKPREPIDSELCSIGEAKQQETLRQQPRALLHLYDSYNNLSLSVSVSLLHSLHNYSLHNDNNNNELTNTICPSYIYTYITFGLITSIASIGMTEHIY